jgi:hypothetical protein
LGQRDIRAPFGGSMCSRLRLTCSAAALTSRGEEGPVWLALVTERYSLLRRAVRQSHRLLAAAQNAPYPHCPSSSWAAFPVPSSRNGSTSNSYEPLYAQPQRCWQALVSLAKGPSFNPAGAAPRRLGGHPPCYQPSLAGVTHRAGCEAPDGRPRARRGPCAKHPSNLSC